MRRSRASTPRLCRRCVPPSTRRQKLHALLTRKRRCRSKAIPTRPSRRRQPFPTVFTEPRASRTAALKPTAWHRNGPPTRTLWCTFPRRIFPALLPKSRSRWASRREIFKCCSSTSAADSAASSARIVGESRSWGTGGVGGGGTPPLPYIFEVPNQRKQNIAIATNQGSARAWRAPNHPQAAVVTMGALEDLAARMNMDPVDFITRNLELTGAREKIYRDELPIAAELMEWKKNWHPRGDKAEGPIKRGVGLSLHTWGGRGHNSDCDLTIHPDGSVEIKMATQDLGTGCRTIIMIVAADTLGIPLDHITLLIGDSRYPVSGASGGSTTSGGVTSSARRAAVDARDQLFAKVAAALKAQPEELEAVNATVRVKSDPSRSLPWKEACAKIGAMPMTVRGKNPDKSKPPDLTN